MRITPTVGPTCQQSTPSRKPFGDRSRVEINVVYVHSSGRILGGLIYCMSPGPKYWGLEPLWPHEVGTDGK